MATKHEGRKNHVDDQQGWVLIVTILILLSVGLFTIMMFRAATGGLSASRSFTDKAKAFYASDGLMTLLCQKVVEGTIDKYIASGCTSSVQLISGHRDMSKGFVYFERFDGISGKSVSNLTAATKFTSNQPDFATNAFRVGYEQIGDNYGSRIRFYVHPPMSGNYIFRCSAWNQAQVWISTDSLPANKVLQITTSKRQEFNDSSHITKSAALNLQQGLKYYVEILHKAGVDSVWVDADGDTHIDKYDGIRFGWIRPDAVEESPLLSDRISTWNPASGGGGGGSQIIGTWTDSIWQVGDLNVFYKVKFSANGGYEIRTDAYKAGPGNTKLYSAPLKQIISSGSKTQLDTVWMPVIFYDYKAGRNPDFNDGYNIYLLPDTVWASDSCYYSPSKDTDLCPGQCYIPGIGNQSCPGPGMVRSTLDSDRKPVANGSGMLWRHLNWWFRPNYANGPDPNAHFIFDAGTGKWKWTNLSNYLGRPNEYVSSLANSATDSMANVVIYDSIYLVRDTTLGPNMYRLTKTSPSQDGRGADWWRGDFLWINDKGFGNGPPFSYGPCGVGFGDYTEPRANYAFAVEMHSDFVYASGLKFNFQGDDNVWIFINNKLEADLGGMGLKSVLINLDTIHGMTAGQTYPFDMFYTESAQENSMLEIQTNMNLYKVVKKKRQWQKDLGF